MTTEQQRDETQDAEADELMRRLRALPRRDLDELRAARAGAELRDAFARQHARASHSFVDRLGALYVRVLEPAWVAALCVAYLGWAFARAFSLPG